MTTESLYTWASSLSSELEEGDFIQFFTDYFRDTSILLSTFITGLLIGIGIAIIFYYVCCNISIRFGNVIAWFLALVVGLGIAFFVTKLMVIGSDGGDELSSTGFYSSIYRTQGSQLENVGDDGTLREEVNETTNRLITEINDGTNSVGTEIALINILYTLTTFIICSILITRVKPLRKLTIHGKSIPF